MNQADIDESVEAFAKGAKRAEDAGLDGVELHGANGYLITQFLSSAINDRTDGYGGSLDNRARFVREIVRAIRQRVKPDFHVQMKISATEYGDALDDDDPKGNTIDESIQVCKWLDRGRRRRDPRLRRPHVPASEESGRRPRARGAASRPTTR